MSNNKTLKDFRYHIVPNNDRNTLVGAYNDLGFAVDKHWFWFNEFPGKYVIIDTKDDSTFTITVTK